MIIFTAFCVTLTLLMKSLLAVIGVVMAATIFAGIVVTLIGSLISSLLQTQ